MSDNAGQFQPGNAAHMTHGARGYLSRTETDKPITINMAEIERSVLADLRANGPRGVLEAALVRNETAARMLWAAMGESPERFISLLKMFCYTSNNATRAARDLAALPTDEPLDARTILDSIRGNDDDNGNG
jgi:hypothetical protein